MAERHEKFDSEGNLLEYIIPNYDGTGTRYDADDNVLETVAMAEPAPPELSDVQKVLKHVIAPQIVAESISDTALEELADLWPEWRPNMSVSVGEVYTHEGVVYEVVQAHPTQPDWLPPDTPALWKAHRPAGEITVWSQPAGAHDAYELGAQVSHNGSNWESTVPANIWEPGVYGWTEL